MRFSKYWWLFLLLAVVLHVIILLAARNRIVYTADNTLDHQTGNFPFNTAINHPPEPIVPPEKKLSPPDLDNTLMPPSQPSSPGTQPFTPDFSPRIPNLSTPQMPPLVNIITERNHPSRSGGTGETVTGDQDGMGQTGGSQNGRIAATKGEFPVIPVVLDSAYGNNRFQAGASSYIWKHFCDIQKPPKFHNSENSVGGFSARQKVSTDNVRDLYGMAYNAIETTPSADTLIVASNFEDGYIPSATQDLIGFLRAHNIRLIVLTGGRAAYPGLSNYARESGGYYALINSDYTNISMDPILPSCEPLSATLQSAVTDPRFHGFTPAWGLDDFVSQMSKLPGTLAPETETMPSVVQNEQDFSIHVLLRAAAASPVKDAASSLQAYIEALTANANHNARAAHAASDAIYYAFTTQNKILLAGAPELIMSAASCGEKVPGQEFSNGAKILNICADFIDELSARQCSPQWSGAILGVINKCQPDQLNGAQSAVNYLQLVFGDKEGLVKCLKEVESSDALPPNDTEQMLQDIAFSTKVMRRITAPLDVLPNQKVSYVEKHVQDAVYMAGTHSWELTGNSSSRSSSQNPP